MGQGWERIGSVLRTANVKYVETREFMAGWKIETSASRSAKFKLPYRQLRSSGENFARLLFFCARWEGVK